MAAFMCWLYSFIDWLNDTATWLDTHNGVLTAIATAVVAWFTVSLAKASKRQATLISNQVELAREEFSAVHRPRIILREAYTIPDRGHLVTVMFNIENTGGSEASVIDSKFVIFFAPMYGTKRQVRFSDELLAGEVDKPIPVGQKIQAGAFYEASCTSPTTYWQEAWDRSMAFKDRLGRITSIGPLDSDPWCVYFYGKISYRDALRIVRNMAFYRVLDFESYRLVAYGDPQLEYSDERA